MCLGGVGMLYMLKSERTPLCGKLVLNLCWLDVVSKSCVSFLCLDILCNEDGVRFVGVDECVNEFMYIHSVKCLTHVKCYSDCVCW